MSDERLTIRFTREEISSIESHAKLLEISKTELVRLAVQGLFTNTSTAEKLDRRLTQLQADLNAQSQAQFTKIQENQKRLTHLLLRVLQAPQEAEDSLAAIIGD